MRAVRSSWSAAGISSAMKMSVRGRPQGALRVGTRCRALSMSFSRTWLSCGNLFRPSWGGGGMCQSSLSHRQRMRMLRRGRGTSIVLELGGPGEPSCGPPPERLLARFGTRVSRRRARSARMPRLPAELVNTERFRASFMRLSSGLELCADPELQYEALVAVAQSVAKSARSVLFSSPLSEPAVLPTSSRGMGRVVQPRRSRRRYPAKSAVGAEVSATRLSSCTSTGGGWRKQCCSARRRRSVGSSRSMTRGRGFPSFVAITL